MAQLFSLSGQTLVDGNGAPYAAAKAYFYETGTTTPKSTYSNAGLSSANANPVVADSDGRFGDIYLVAGRYKVVFATSADVTIDTLDPVDATSQLIAQAAAPGTTYPFLRYHNTTDGNVYRRNAANSAWINEGPVDSLINAASVSETLTGTATDKAVTPDSLASIWQRGTDIASASTLSLPASGGGVFNVTGTTGVTGISSAQGGRCVKLRFAGALTITHNGTSLILPGAANITTVAGDTAEFINEAAADASGSNWRCFNYVRADGNPVFTGSAIASKTGNYTATTADKGKSIRFTGLSAGATLTLPSAASCADGFILYVSCEDTGLNPPYVVTVDPDGAELIDGAATRKMCSGTRVTLLCDGTGWRTVAGTWVMISSRQTISSGDDANFAHGQPTAPFRVTPLFINLSTEGGWAVGDRVFVSNDSSSAGTLGISYGGDATNLFYVIASAGAPRIFNKTTGASVTMTAGSWALHLTAEF